MKRATDTSLEVAPFALKLPKEFDFKPDFVVDMPGGRKVNIYKTTARDYNGSDREKKAPAFRAILLNKNGRPVTNRNCEFRGDTTYIDPLDMAFYLERMAMALSKQKRTTVEEVDHDD